MPQKYGWWMNGVTHGVADVKFIEKMEFIENNEKFEIGNKNGDKTFYTTKS